MDSRLRAAEICSDQEGLVARNLGLSARIMSVLPQLACAIALLKLKTPHSRIELASSGSLLAVDGPRFALERDDAAPLGAPSRPSEPAASRTP